MRRSLTLSLGVAAVAGLLLAGCERPPVDTVQRGYRGLAMGLVYNPRTEAKVAAANQPPAVTSPPAEASADSPLAKTVYQNVQVLDDLNVAQFARLMIAITEWVAPPGESCAYCHSGDNMSNDDNYRKVVSRQMLRMVRNINGSWKDHVGTTGVTCYTCHRGQQVPQYVWYKDPGQPHASEMAGSRAGQNAPSPVVGLTSLPNDPFTAYLNAQAPSIRVVSTAALPDNNASTIKQAEASYGLMMHMSESLGVNCTFCHNSRSFAAWDSSTPQRATAWYGIRMVRDANAHYLEPLTATFPANRKGPLGDVAKVDCQTCHQGVYKPMFGAPMLKDYPELVAQAPPAAAPAAADTTAPAVR